MKKIRIGKDISVRWPILTNGEAESLDGRDLKLFIKSQYNVAKEIKFSTEQNIVLFTFPGTEQQMLGTYKLTLWENYGKRGQTAVDCCEAFQLVSCTCQEASDCGGLTPEEVPLEPSCLEVGVGNFGSSVTVVQELGKSTTAVMSQDAVTRELKQTQQDMAADTDAALQDARKYADSLDATVRKDARESIAQSLTDAKEYTNDRETAIRADMDTENADVRALIASRVGLPEFNTQDYTLTFTAQNGATVIVDLPLETMGLDYDAETKEMIYTAADGSKRRISLADFVDIYVGSVGSEIQITVDTGNVIRATLLNGTVSWDKLAGAVQQKINNKVDKVPGKGLSSEDFTTAEKEKLAIINVESDLVPAVGTTGQVLTKIPGGSAWQDAPGGGALPFKVVTLDFNRENFYSLTDEQASELDEAGMLVIVNSLYNSGAAVGLLKRPLVLFPSFYAYTDNGKTVKNFFSFGENNGPAWLRAQYGYSQNKMVLSIEKFSSAASLADAVTVEEPGIAPADLTPADEPGTIE